MFLNLLALTVLFSSAATAWKWGGLDERLASTGFIIATMVTPLVNSSNYGNPETGILVVDGLLLIGLLALAMRSDRFWPMWAAAFQLVGTTVHIASMTETGDFAKAYANALVFWSYPVLFSLIIGTWLEARKRGW